MARRTESVSLTPAVLKELEYQILVELKKATPKSKDGFSSGRLREGWRTSSRRVVVTPVSSVVELEFTNRVPYGRWVNDGTGVYGKYKKRIVSPTGKTLKFSWRGETVYRRSVRGQPAKNFVRDAIKSLQRKYPSATFTRKS